MPKDPPPAAQGMKLVFADDFDGPLSISKDGRGARYCAHKPGGGDFSGWPFSDPEGALNPFSQRGTFLRIRASKPAGTKGGTGLIASINQDGVGVSVGPPSYFECRFVCQSAPGTWPAFWTMTTAHAMHKSPIGGDELDIIEGYGGLGKGNPNQSGYHITTHFWSQKGPDGKRPKPEHQRVNVLDLGGKSFWSWTFHTYGVKVTAAETIYYFDDIEVFRHPTGKVSRTEPMFFLINYAIGGISRWPIDLQRYGNISDMYVDYVRVYQGGP